MKFILAEEFLSQSKEVQHELLEWWQPEVGDLHCNLYNNQENNVLVINKCQFIFKSFKEDIKKFGVPLLTEGQLIRFIEEKTNRKVEITLNVYRQYDFMIVDNHEDFYVLESREEDLLKALWKVAIKIINRN